jgi:hypothetical protein
LKTTICRKYSFQKLILFLQGNKALEAPGSNTHSFLSRDTCVSSIQLNRPIWSKQSLSPSEAQKLQEVFLSQTTSIPTGKQRANVPSSNTHAFLPRDIYMFFNLAKQTYLEQREQISTLKLLSSGSIPFEN